MRSATNILLVFLLFIGVALVLITLRGKSSPSPASPSPTPTNTQIVGGDKDEHGCIPSAGYSWCEAKNKCLRSWEESCTTPSITDDATESLKQSIKEQIINKRGPGAANLTISVFRIEGNYAKGDASEIGMGGGIWFAAKVENEWVLVWDGNGIIQCSDTSPYPNFPNSLIPECYDVALDKMVTR